MSDWDGSCIVSCVRSKNTYSYKYYIQCCALSLFYLYFFAISRRFIFLHNFFICLVSAATDFVLPLPPTPSFIEELHDITLVWNYTLDGTVILASFLLNTGGGIKEIARKQNGMTTVIPSFQGRFSANVTNTQAWLKIVGVQRTDDGKYEFELTPSTIGKRLQHEVTVVVKCKLIRK